MPTRQVRGIKGNYYKSRSICTKDAKIEAGKLLEMGCNVEIRIYESNKTGLYTFTCLQEREPLPDHTRVN